MTRVPVYPRRFCLDANLSYRAADALHSVGLPFAHVSEPFPHPTIRGRCTADDETLIAWSRKTENVLVTADNDFEGVWVRQGTMERYGVEVVVFGFMPEGPVEHLRQILKNFERWKTELESQPYQHRVWVQPERRPLYLKQGKKAKRKQRQSATDSSALPPPASQLHAARRV